MAQKSKAEHDSENALVPQEGQPGRKLAADNQPQDDKRYRVFFTRTAVLGKHMYRPDMEVEMTGAVLRAVMEDPRNKDSVHSFEESGEQQS